MSENGCPAVISILSSWEVGYFPAWLKHVVEESSARSLTARSLPAWIKRGIPETAARIAAAETGQDHYNGQAFRLESYAAVLQAKKPGAIIHFTDGLAGFFYSGNLWIRRGPLVATFSDRPADLESGLPYHRQLERLDRIIVQTEAQAAFFARQAAGERIVRIPMGVDHSFFKPDKGKRLRRGLVVEARHFPEKALFSSLLEISARRWPDAPITVLGDFDRSWLPDGVKPAILENPTAGERKTLFVRSLAVLFPCREFCSCTTLLEALSCRAPVVATDVGAVREYAGPADSHISRFSYSREANLQAFMDGVELAVEGPEMLVERSRLARKRVLRKFGIAAVAKRYKAMFRELAESWRK